MDVRNWMFLITMVCVLMLSVFSVVNWHHRGSNDLLKPTASETFCLGTFCVTTQQEWTEKTFEKPKQKQNSIHWEQLWLENTLRQTPQVVYAKEGRRRERKKKERKRNLFLQTCDGGGKEREGEEAKARTEKQAREERDTTIRFASKRS